MNQLSHASRPQEVKVAVGMLVLATAFLLLDNYLFFAASAGWARGAQQFWDRWVFVGVFTAVSLCSAILLLLRQGWLRWYWVVYWTFLLVEQINAHNTPEKLFGVIAIGLGGVSMLLLFTSEANAWFAARRHAKRDQPTN